MNIYIYSKISEELIQQKLRDIDSPIINLYKNGYSEKENIAAVLNGFLQPQMQNYKIPDDMKLIEAQALVNWIFKSLNNDNARLEATHELIKLLIERYQFSDEIEISKGIAYLSSKVDLKFIGSIEDFYKNIEEMYSIGKTLFYRGHSEANYILLPSLMRKENWHRNERKMYNELIINCPSNFEKMKSHLEYLVEMQHYGLPTRLLDITRNPLVALYFACENNHESYGEIVIFSVDDREIKYPQSDTISILASLPLFEYEKQQEIYNYAIESLAQDDFNKNVQRLLHEVKTEKPAFKDQIIKEDLLHSRIVLPLKNNNRILKQDGSFILCGLSIDYRHLDVNDLRYNAINGKRQVFIVESKRKFIDVLNAYSINKATLFPEIDDVADYIKGKY
ncbi:FRG domain-containing protein [Desulfosporosinus shakirovi]|uniref:FRG domain-containing protein n=1 Tax=Desulfosporosinus shakirovi TaxID=2885154 RepID=UPI001E510A0C|nr:FRG domain-containing protein [Desulfosporosinus sp. SRJS8]MCB8817386.1 FRG domain-containing protein [Desulfosporosinus sp. SRJS8]